jgi:SAM-dependent methyltransferase
MTDSDHGDYEWDAGIIKRRPSVREQSKSAKRRYNDGAFHSRYFVGHGLDIGGKPDPLALYVSVFCLLKSVRTWDLEDGDARYLRGLGDSAFDFVHSSHCLEHMVDVEESLRNWIRVLKPSGYLIVTVPDEDLYEQGIWPSRHNRDHKWTFTMAKSSSWSPRSVNMIDLVRTFVDQLQLERLTLHSDFYRPTDGGTISDQTMTPVAECSIEMVCRKREATSLRSKG